MHTIKKEFNFCAAHRLPNHPGKCRFIHGHNYKVVVTAQSSGVNDQGMVIDFSTLTKVVNDILQTEYDHRLILWSQDVVAELLLEALHGEQAQNIVIFPVVPTAENMSKHFLYQLNDALIFQEILDFTIKQVEVYETPTASAIFIPEEPINEN